jgi:hypothetical protein
MKWSIELYEKTVDEHRKVLLDRDGCLDNACDEALDMLMYIPGLGPYIHNKLKAFDSTSKLARDIIKGNNL